VLGDAAWDSMPHLKRWLDLINTRPAAARISALKDKYTFKAQMDDEARSHMFRHIAAV
jgi:GST-like protein